MKLAVCWEFLAELRGGGCLRGLHPRGRRLALQLFMMYLLSMLYYIPSIHSLPVQKYSSIQPDDPEPSSAGPDARLDGREAFRNGDTRGLG